MSIQLQNIENYTLIKINNESLDMNISSSLKAELILAIGDGNINMILDISKCKYCDSSGLSAILVGNRLCNNSKGIFILSSPQQPVERLITITQLDDVLNITDNNEEAIKRINEHIH